MVTVGRALFRVLPNRVAQQSAFFNGGQGEGLEAGMQIFQLVFIIGQQLEGEQAEIEGDQLFCGEGYGDVHGSSSYRQGHLQSGKRLFFTQGGHAEAAAFGHHFGRPVIAQSQRGGLFEAQAHGIGADAQQDGRFGLLQARSAVAQQVGHLGIVVQIGLAQALEGGGIGGGLRFAAVDFRFQRIKCLDVLLFPQGGLCAGETHAEENKAVAGDFVGGSFFAFAINVANERKIAPVKFRRAFKHLNSTKHIFVLFAESVGNCKGGCDETVAGMAHQGLRCHLVILFERRDFEECPYGRPSAQNRYKFGGRIPLRVQGVLLVAHSAIRRAGSRGQAARIR
nr:MAG TPA: hypothetical protein [Caudoviricetes sp.]